MSLLPPEIEQAGGHAPPSVRQFGVFLDNKVGKLLELLRHGRDGSVTRLDFGLQLQRGRRLRVAVGLALAADEVAGRNAAEGCDDSYDEWCH
jgi:hypothetical protein